MVNSSNQRGTILLNFWSSSPITSVNFFFLSIRIIQKGTGKSFILPIQDDHKPQDTPLDKKALLAQRYFQICQSNPACSGPKNYCQPHRARHTPYKATAKDMDNLESLRRSISFANKVPVLITRAPARIRLKQE